MKNLSSKQRCLFFIFRTIGFVFFIGFIVNCSSKDYKMENLKGSQGDRLNKIISEYTESIKYVDSYDATYYNLEKELEYFGDYSSPEYFDRIKKIVSDSISQLNQIHPEELNFLDRQAYFLLNEHLQVKLRWFDFPNRYLNVDQMGSRLKDYMDSSSQSLTSFPFDSVNHYKAYLKRMNGFGVYVDHQINLLKQGIKKKIVLNCIVAKKVRGTYKEALQLQVEKNPFFRPVLFMPKEFSDEDKATLSGEFRKNIKEKIIPYYRKFDQFFTQEYLPKCNSRFGLSSYPQGREWYKSQIKASTGLDLDSNEVHQLGLREVDRIRHEMIKIKEDLQFKGDYKKFLKSLMSNPKNFFNNSDEMFKKFVEIKEKVATKIPDYFSLIPKSDYTIVQSSNPEDAAGSYEGPTEMIGFGKFHINTINLKSVPRFRAVTLSLHEAIPGHHFQIALAFERKNQISEFQRKIFYSVSFVEGWALYAEYLGNEMGMYQDPMDRFGHLTDEMLRAVRLVVDTGIHSLGWSQKKAIKYMKDNLADSEKGIQIEVNRYSVWPGQALGYKIGQLKILELRKKAENELGAQFNLKDFHTSVIGHGTVSLAVLESQVNDWIRAKMKEKTK